MSIGVEVEVVWKGKCTPRLVSTSELYLISMLVPQIVHAVNGPGGLHCASIGEVEKGEIYHLRSQIAV